MSSRHHRHSYSHGRPARPERHVRFSLPLEPAARRTQPTISRVPTPRLREQITLTAATTLPSSYIARLNLAHESLHDIRAFLEAACNFHGAEKRRALSVPSISVLSSLLAQVNQQRGGMDRDVTRRLEAILRHAEVDMHARHPHEQLLVEPAPQTTHERNARRGQRRRARREAEWRLQEFVSRQLHIPMEVLRELPRKQRHERELDAFRQRIRRFNVPRPPPGVVHLEPGTSSVPQSPADRRYTEPRPPETDPPRYVRRAYGMEADGVPDMGDLNLPAAVHQAQGPALAHAVHARLTAMQAGAGQYQPQAYMGVYGASPAQVYPAGTATGYQAYQTVSGAVPHAPVGGIIYPQPGATTMSAADVRGSYIGPQRY